MICQPSWSDRGPSADHAGSIAALDSIFVAHRVAHSEMEDAACMYFNVRGARNPAVNPLRWTLGPMIRLHNIPRRILLFCLHRSAIASALGSLLLAAIGPTLTLAQGPGGQPGFGMGGSGGLGGRMNVSAFAPEGPGGPRRARQCLVLYNGTTFYGRLTTHGLNYKIEQANGELVIPFTQVRAAADSTEEAYGKLRRAIKDPSIEQFLWLARWCQDQGMQEESRQLCDAILKAEPDNSDAIRLRKKAESRRDVKLAQFRPVATGEDPIVVTAAGISPGANADFIRRIQPLLINSCARRGCHTTDSKQDFRLSAYRLHDGPRYRSEENLAETLKRVTFSNPERSPLLLSTRTSDHHRNVFDGPGGEECREQLRAWVLRISLEQNWIRRANQAAAIPSAQPMSPPNIRIFDPGIKKGK